MRVAFLGAGQMGAPMAERLLSAGHEVTVFDPSAAATRGLVALGAGLAGSVAEAVSGAEAAFACLPGPEVSRAVALGPGGVASAAAVPGVYVEMSTIGAATVADIAAGLAGRGISVIDAPVSGGPRGARAGTLAAMAAGPEDALATVLPALNAIAGRVIRVGDKPGQGQVAKLVNNMISATCMAVSFEAICMGVKAGIDAETLVDAVNASTGRNGATLDKFPASILPRSFDFGGKLATMAKDVDLALAEFRRLTVPHPVAAAAAQVWLSGMAEGRGDDDYTSLVQIVERAAGVKIRGRARDV